MPLQRESEQRKYTYADYLAWPEDERIELIDGVPYHTYGGPVFEGGPVMLAAPARVHQVISRNLFRQIDRFLTGKPCEAYYAPFAVRLNAAENDDTTLEPDISVVCDESKLDDRGCNGAPDYVAEILSSSTARKDRLLKYQKYQQAGVREYWIVDPDTRSLQACVMNESGFYVAVVYSDTDIAPVAVLPGCEINLADVFAV
jgi:Uma2 family endonuclease